MMKMENHNVVLESVADVIILLESVNKSLIDESLKPWNRPVLEKLKNELENTLFFETKN